MAGMLMAFVHQMNPFIIEFSPGIGIRWYGAAYLAGAFLGYGLTYWLARRGRARIRPEIVFDFALTLLVGAFVGGRLGFCLLYDQRLLGLMDSFPFWGVLALHQGGMASHGGIIGMLLAAWWFARRHGLDLWHLLDIACLCGPLGVMLGRLANFVNGELYGRVCPPGLSWAVQFPKEIFTYPPKQLAQLAGAAEAVGVPRVDWLGWLARPEWADGKIGETLRRIVEAVEHGSVAVVRQLEPVLSPRYPSQLIQAGLEGLAVFVVLAIIWAWPRKPGVVAGWFVVLYAVARTLGEQFREPDTELGFELFGLTRGQELSLIMLIVGIGIVVWRSRRPVPKFAGWIGPMPTP